MSKSNNAPAKIVTAAMLAIGDELLSGRTKDKNIGFLADFLTLHAIDLKEVRIVADEHEAIVAALTELRQRFDLVFTSGGIGPTHDDITADAVAASFKVAIDHDPRVMEFLGTHYRERGMEFTPARKRMARIPEGAELITNPVSMAPGFKIGNVHVLAGVPSVFRAMLGELSSGLEGGDKILSATHECPFGEGTIGDRLAEIQARHTETSIGSYPQFDGKRYSTQLIVRGRSQASVDAASADIAQMLKELSSS